MKTRIIRIGNSRGIRLPKAIIQQLGFRDEVHLEVGESELVIRSSAAPRSGWEEAFMQMADRGDDALISGDMLPSEWDEKEWVW